MKCSEVSELLSAYADGEVSGREAARLKAHIEQCDACRAELEALGALQSRLTEMMGEPMEGTDVSDLVMASLPARRRPLFLRWAWVGAAACLLALIGLRLMLPTGHSRRTPQRTTTSRPAHMVPARSVPKHPAPVVAKKPGERHEVIRRPVVVYRPHPRHRTIRQYRPLRQPDQPQALPETAQLVVTNKVFDGRVERTLKMKLGNMTLCRTRVTEVTLAPNEDAATIVRPALEVIENRPAETLGQYGG